MSDILQCVENANFKSYCSWPRGSSFTREKEWRKEEKERRVFNKSEVQVEENTRQTIHSKGEITMQWWEGKGEKTKWQILKRWEDTAMEGTEA